MRWWLTGIAVFVALFSIWARMMWYMVFALPFYYLAAVYMLALRKQVNTWGLYALAGVMIANLHLSYKNFLKNTVQQGAYNNYCRGILATIPDKTSVFLSAIPDPYYCFLEAKRSNRLVEFPVVTMPQEAYGAVLHSTDYAIIQGYYETMLFGNYLDRYLKMNSLETVTVSDWSNRYQTWVMKLKPATVRHLPE